LTTNRQTRAAVKLCQIPWAKSESQIRMDVQKELHDELFDFLVCQSCEEEPKEGHIYTCNSGDHATCNACFQTIKVCKCKANIKHRNKVLEKMRATMPLSCKFRKNGCTAVLTLDSLVYHEDDCQWRPIVCPVFVPCNNKKIIFNLFDDHMTEHHTVIANQSHESFIEEKIVPVNADECFNNAPKRHIVWGTTKLSLNGAQFFRMMRMDQKNYRFYLWVYYYGFKEDAKNYNCTIKVFGGDYEEFIYKGHPSSLDESREEVIDGDCCLSISRSQAKRIVAEGKMNCSVKICCPKEEARDEDVESGVSDNETIPENNSN
jgi:hypothetical protein